MKNILLSAVLLFAASCPLSAYKGSPTAEKSSDDIDVVIKDLEEKRDLELSRAIKNKDQGDRLQFSNISDARKFWEMSEINKKNADEYQKQIDALKGKTNGIINEEK